IENIDVSAYKQLDILVTNSLDTPLEISLYQGRTTFTDRVRYFDGSSEGSMELTLNVDFFRSLVGRTASLGAQAPSLFQQPIFPYDELGFRIDTANGEAPTQGSLSITIL